ncbi:MAG: hypothetical protein H7831_06310 [Magnetococcus sp. WYHC-3]
MTTMKRKTHSAVGMRHLLRPQRDVHWVRRLFEKGVAGFFAAVLTPAGWRIDIGRRLEWQNVNLSPGIGRLLPGMRTDIMLDHLGLGRRIIIDTKFTAAILSGQYGQDTLRSERLYQIYAYLRSREADGDPLSDQASGLLLYPSMGHDMDETVRIQGHQIRFATVDLAASSRDIRQRLLHVVDM